MIREKVDGLLSDTSPSTYIARIMFHAARLRLVGFFCFVNLYLLLETPFLFLFFLNNAF
jgi:hypothetical protein